jgi:Protein of unknown function (DUF3341)
MTRRIVQCVFEREQDLVGAARSIAAEGWSIVDIYTPYALHPTAQLMGLGRSRLPRAAFVFGAIGVGLAFWFQFWVSAQDWPLNVGGRPWNSLPAFVPVAFEMMVLCAGLGLVATWMVVCRMFPGKEALLPAAGVTDDRFVLQVRAPGAQTDSETIRSILQKYNASDLTETEGA